MLPDLSFLLAVLLGLGAFGAAPHDPLTAFVGTGATAAIAIAWIRMLGDRAVRALDEQGPPAAVVGMAWMTLPAFAGWIVMLQALRYGAAVHALLPATTWLLRYVLLFAPMLLLFGAVWAVRGRVELALAAAVGRPAPHASATAAVRAGLKRNGLALIPMAVLIGLVEGLQLAADMGVPGCAVLLHAVEDLPQAEVAFVFLVLAVLAWVLPAVLSRLLASEPFPAGPLKERLERLAAAQRLAYREMRLWKTGGRGLNAMVVGITPGSRRIFVTDGLIRALPPEEVEAVFCHEAAHAKRNHLLWFLGLTGLTSLVFRLLDQPLASVGIVGLSQSLLHLAVLWFGILGWVSRHFERESDVDGGKHAALLEPVEARHALEGLPEPIPEGALRMVRALKRLESIVGDAPSHRHGTLSDRAAYVAIHATHAPVRAAFERRSRGMRLAFVALGVLAVGVAVARLPSDLALAGAHGELRAAEGAYDRAFRAVGRDDPAAAAAWREAQRAFLAAAQGLEGRTGDRPRRERVLAWLGLGDTALRGTGDRATARRGFERALTEAAALGGALGAHAAFTAQVDLARLALHEGGPLADVEAAAARAERMMPAADGALGAYYRARLRLLDGALQLARGEREKGERTLGQLRDDASPADEWVELRRDAALELERAGAAGSGKPVR